MPDTVELKPSSANLLRRNAWEIGVLVALLAILGTWVVGVPRYAAPDEPAHTVKAFGTARGETIGIPIPELSVLTRAFRAPLTLASGNPECFAFFPNIPASCAVPNTDTTWSEIATTAATYPPWYYVVVGGVTRIAGQDTSVRAYRAVTAVGSALILTAAMALAARLGRRRPAVLLLALTPMAVFLLPMVNPTAWEISGMLVLWVSLARLRLGPTLATRRQLLTATSIGAAIIVVRPVALPWVGIALLSYLVVERRLREADRRATLRLLGTAAIPLAIAVVLSTAWSRYAGVALTDDKFVRDESYVDIFRVGIGRTNWLFDQAVGVLGWVDTWIPAGSVAMVILGFALAGSMVLFSGEAAVRWVLGGLVAIWVLYPAIYVTLAKTPEVWQGRYNLPLLGGLVFCVLLTAATEIGAEQIRRAALFFAIGFAVAEPLAFHQTLRRFMVGAEGDILLRDRAWWPPVEAWLLVMINVIAAAGLATLALRSPEPADR